MKHSVHKSLFGRHTTKTLVGQKKKIQDEKTSKWDAMDKIEAAE